MKWLDTVVTLVIMWVALYYLWNWIMPLFGLPAITFAQAFGIRLLAETLFHHPQHIKSNAKGE